jgi:hypothetical protein
MICRINGGNFHNWEYWKNQTLDFIEFFYTIWLSDNGFDKEDNWMSAMVSSKRESILD